MKKIGQLDTKKITSNGETCHKVDTNQISETEAYKVADDEPKEDTTSPEASKSDSGHDTQTDNALVNSTQDNVAELPDQDHSQVPLKNQI